MARLAFGAKWGAFGASGFCGFAASSANALSPSMDAKARPPMPVDMRPKNWRRVVASNDSRLSSWMNGFIGSALGNHFVEVQDHVGDHSPGRRLGRVHPRWQLARLARSHV